MSQRELGEEDEEKREEAETTDLTDSLAGVATMNQHYFRRGVAGRGERMKGPEGWMVAVMEGGKKCHPSH